ncbi:MAG: GNAT family N-acetyltransferase [Bdellovibrionales bacterium]
MSSLQIVPFEPEFHGTLVPSLTQILHLSYSVLAARGMRYHASYQDADVTLERLLEGESYLAFFNDELVGTITLVTSAPSSVCDWYRRPRVFHFGQFAVHPDYQGRGIGSRMMELVETRAFELGAEELALDTAEHADHLIEMYSNRGYRFIEHVQWEITNYRSVILSRHLRPTVTKHLSEQPHEGPPQ